MNNDIQEEGEVLFIRDDNDRNNLENEEVDPQFATAVLIGLILPVICFLLS